MLRWFRKLLERQYVVVNGTPIVPGQDLYLTFGPALGVAWTSDRARAWEFDSFAAASAAVAGMLRSGQPVPHSIKVA